MKNLRHVDILYGRYLDEDLNITIGGVQTYITDLYRLLNSMNIYVRIIQFSKVDFVHQITENTSVVGFAINGKFERQRLYDKSVSSRSQGEFITIFATDIIIPSHIQEKSLAIQHGIFWDVENCEDRGWLKQLLSRAISLTKLHNRIEKVDALVCVDNNFLNWYRTQVDKINNKIRIIPNYSPIAERADKTKGNVNIIFARRLFRYRGTYDFTKAIKRVLERYEGINVTVAGNGPDEAMMREELEKYPNVKFIRYEKDESLEVHKTQHIAVIPSTGSEGTSLSLLEAMSAQCAVICTNVGGMTNIVLNGYNGIMVNVGDTDALYEAICYLVENPEDRERMAEKAYETVLKGFSHERWNNAWKKVIMDMFENNSIDP